MIVQGVLLQRRGWRFGNVNTLTGITVALVGLLALQVSLPLIISYADYPAIYWRATGVVAVLVGLGVALTPLIGRLFGERVLRRTAPPTRQPGSGQQEAAGTQPAQVTPVAVVPVPTVEPDPTAN